MADHLYTNLAKFSSIVMILPSSMAAGWFLGHFVVDKFLGTSNWGSIIFVLLGAGAGFYEIMRILTDGQRGKKL